MDHPTDIFSYIQTQENNYKQGIKLAGNWPWSMKEHLETSYLYINSQLTTGKDDFKPVKNIILPILNLQHRTEDIEVKDVDIYVDDPEAYHLSFLVKKYHDDVFVVENDMETFFDDLNISRIDMGAGLSKQLSDPCPEVVDLQSISFCDQTDILSGPIGIQHFYSPDQLLEKASVGWGDKANGATATLEATIALAQTGKREESTKNETPGRYIEVREVHGNLPRRFADPLDTSETYETRIFIVCVYNDTTGNPKGTILYTKPETKSPFKLIKRDKVYGRALGRGGAEELFDPQVWTTYDMIRKQGMLDAAAITILKTTDPAVAAKNDVKNMDNLDIIELATGTDIGQMDTFPRNIQLFTQSAQEWEVQARTLGGATDAVLGENPTAGTPFKLQTQVIQQGLGLHEYRRGQYAKHIEEIYNDWIIPHIEKKVTEGMTFLSELSLEDLQYVMEGVITNMANNYAVDMVIATGGQGPLPAELDIFKQLARSEFKKKGSSHFIEILKGEFKNKALRVKVSVKGKSKDLSAKTDGLVNVFRQIIANPAVLHIPAIAKIFNDIIEDSGLDPVDFSGITAAQTGAATPNAPSAGVEQPQQGFQAPQPQNA